MVYRTGDIEKKHARADRREFSNVGFGINARFVFKIFQTIIQKISTFYESNDDGLS